MESSALASAEYWLSWIATAKLVAAFLVAAGVVVEFGGDFIARPYEKVVNAAREERLAALQKIISESEERVAQLEFDSGAAEKQIAEANERAAKAVEGAAKAAAEVAKVAEQLAPLNLSVDQQRRIAESLKKFKGQTVTIVPRPPGDAGTAVFVGQLHGILIDAGWLVLAVPPESPTAPMFPGGVFVQYIDDHQLSEAGRTLTAELTKNGIQVGYGGTVTDKAPPGLTVFVSPKAHPQNIEAMNAAIFGMIGRAPKVPPPKQ